MSLDGCYPLVTAGTTCPSGSVMPFPAIAKGLKMRRACNLNLSSPRGSADISVLNSTTSIYLHIHCFRIDNLSSESSLSRSHESCRFCYIVQTNVVSSAGVRSPPPFSENSSIQRENSKVGELFSECSQLASFSRLEILACE